MCKSGSGFFFVTNKHPRKKMNSKNLGGCHPNAEYNMRCFAVEGSLSVAL
jgi:hypothetical protein